jgi:hypothetical protein
VLWSNAFISLRDSNGSKTLGTTALLFFAIISPPHNNIKYWSKRYKYLQMHSRR